MNNDATTTAPGSLATCADCGTHLKWTGEVWIDDEGENFAYDARGHEHTPRPGTVRTACSKPLAIGETVRGLVNTGRERTCGYPAMVGTDRCSEHTLPADHPLVSILAGMRTNYARGGDL